MFTTVVFIFLMSLLILCSGAALHLGIFKVHKPESGFAKKALGGIVSYGISAIVWIILYSYHYLGW